MYVVNAWWFSSNRNADKYTRLHIRISPEYRNERHKHTERAKIRDDKFPDGKIMKFWKEKSWTIFLSDAAFGRYGASSKLGPSPAHYRWSAQLIGRGDFLE